MEGNILGRKLFYLEPLTWIKKKHILFLKYQKIEQQLEMEREFITVIANSITNHQNDIHFHLFTINTESDNSGEHLSSYGGAYPKEEEEEEEDWKSFWSFQLKQVLLVGKTRAAESKP